MKTYKQKYNQLWHDNQKMKDRLFLLEETIRSNGIVHPIIFDSLCKKYAVCIDALKTIRIHEVRLDAEDNFTVGRSLTRTISEEALCQCGENLT